MRRLPIGKASQLSTVWSSPVIIPHHPRPPRKACWSCSQFERPRKPSRKSGKPCGTQKGDDRMKKRFTTGLLVAAALVGIVVAGQDKYSANVPGGLALSEFRGYEDWQAIGISRSDK